LFFYWLFGTSIPFFNSIIENLKLAEILISFVSTPILGFVISTIATQIVRIWMLPNRIEFLEPKDNFRIAYLEQINTSFNPNISGLGEIDGQINIVDIKLLYLAHTSLFLSRANSEAILFSSRRLDVYHMHVSTIGSIILGFLIAIILCLNYGILGHFNFLKTISTIPILAYIFLGIIHARRSLHEANDFEKIYLLK
jgi:hypothetical protein